MIDLAQRMHASAPYDMMDFPDSILHDYWVMESIVCAWYYEIRNVLLPYQQGPIDPIILRDLCIVMRHLSDIPDSAFDEDKEEIQNLPAPALVATCSTYALPVLQSVLKKEPLRPHHNDNTIKGAQNRRLCKSKKNRNKRNTVRFNDQAVTKEVEI